MPEAGLKESLRFYAKALKMPTFAHIEDMVQSFQPGQSLEAFTVQLLKREYELRQENQRKRRIKRARFPLLKTMEDFDLTRLEHVKPEYIKQLASCGFIDRHENVVMIGNPGTGKTHLMTAIGFKACLKGYSVLFYHAASLATELKEARDTYMLSRMEKAIAKADLLLLDELSYASFGQEESELLFKVIAERSERASTMITTNLEFSRWPDMFANETLVAALVDRLTYHSHVLNMNGASFRLDSHQMR
ncbi:IS21-like element helper ATPase IstB [Mitsuokella jalaludinii]|uniref:IS21-like element helper ATPase IstB n=1 Tax=Mitsuokella jalaludinii TaxID=187979 RepID=UPI001D00C141|nr:IS21-like element helper ATPase IstB [Mitsuokella jalaludinii]MCB5726074.1 IS21-like element helper ATPase IstB [Mitsuokella jalaludinii]